eukprot:Em0003g1451a
MDDPFIMVPIHHDPHCNTLGVVAQQGLCEVCSSADCQLMAFPGPQKGTVRMVYVRAWPGGVGDRKLGSNYGPTIRVQKIAESKGCNQVLWLLGKEEQKPEIATPPLLGTILDGVVRKSALELARSWGTHTVKERSITMADVKRAVTESRMKEMFGSGTACVICPISRFCTLMK